MVGNWFKLIWRCFWLVIRICWWVKCLVILFCVIINWFSMVIWLVFWNIKILGLLLFFRELDLRIFLVLVFKRVCRLFCFWNKFCIMGFLLVKWLDLVVIIVFIFCNCCNRFWCFGFWFRLRIINVFDGESFKVDFRFDFNDFNFFSFLLIFWILSWLVW